MMVVLCSAAMTAAAVGQTAPQHSVKRNPFVPPMTGAVDRQVPTPHQGATDDGGRARVPHPPNAGNPVSHEAAVPAPPFSLAGIVQSPNGTQALLGDKVSRTVTVGDVVQGYRVTQIDIDGRAVTVDRQHHAFKLLMPIQK
jgi:hypothetical protein